MYIILYSLGYQAPYPAGPPVHVPQGYYPPPNMQPSYMQGQPPHTIVVQPQVVAVVGGCPACRVSTKHHIIQKNVSEFILFNCFNFNV